MPAPLATPAKRPDRRRAAARSAVLAISSLASPQDRPMPRWAVSIASATANPWSQRWSRKRRVDSQSTRSPLSIEATWAAA